MSESIESAQDIGRTLSRRLRAVGIASRAEFPRVGDAQAFRRLVARDPHDACTHTRLALAGAARGVRWMELPQALREALKQEVSKP